MSRMATRKTSTPSKSKSKQQQQQQQNQNQKKKKKKEAGTAVVLLNGADASSSSSSGGTNRKCSVQMTTHPNRTKEALLRCINPKASRKKVVLNRQKDALSTTTAAAAVATVAVNGSGSGSKRVVVVNGTNARNNNLRFQRMTNFSSSLKTKKKKTTTAAAVHNHNPRRKSLPTKEITQQDTKDTATSVGKEEEEDVLVAYSNRKKEERTTENRINKRKRLGDTNVTQTPNATMAEGVVQETAAAVAVVVVSSTLPTSISNNSSSSKSKGNEVICDAAVAVTASARIKDEGGNTKQQLAISEPQRKESAAAAAASSDDDDDDDLKHIVDTIERVASGKMWIDSSVAASTSSSSSSSVDSGDDDKPPSNETINKKKKRAQATSNKRSIRLRSRSVSLEETRPPASPPPPPASTDQSSGRRPYQNRRVACLNAMAKVHCLYESEVRYNNNASTVGSTTKTSSSSSSNSSKRTPKVTIKANAKKRGTTSKKSRSRSSSSSSSSSDSSSSDSNSDDSDGSDDSDSEPAKKQISKSTASSVTNANAKKKKKAKKNSEISKKKPPDKKKKTQTAKKGAPSVKKRQSMEVPSVVNLSELVMPKRMASLNATAILAASSQNWSDNNRSSSSSSTAAAAASRRSNQQSQQLMTLPSTAATASTTSSKKKSTKIKRSRSKSSSDDDDEEERRTVAASDPKKRRKSSNPVVAHSLANNNNANATATATPTAPKKAIKSRHATQEAKETKLAAAAVRMQTTKQAPAAAAKKERSPSAISSYSAAAATGAMNSGCNSSSLHHVSTHSIHRMDIIETSSSSSSANVIQVEKKMRAINSTGGISGVTSRSHATSSSNRRVASRVVEIIETTSSLNTSSSSTSSSAQKTGDAAGRYSPLGALYNMRPPNGASVAQQRSHHQTDVDDDNDDDKQQQPTVVGGVKVAISPTGSGSGSGSGGNGSQQVVKEQSPSDASSTSKLMWTPDRLISSMPPVHFGGVPLVLSNPIQTVDSYATATRFAPAFSLYRPPFDIPYTSFYQPPPLPISYPIPHHFATAAAAAAAASSSPSPFYRGFALLPPNGFVPVALADPYSAAAAAAAAAYAFAQSPGPAAIAGPATTAENWSYLLHRHQQQPQFGLPCNPLARYLPTIAPCPTDFLSHTRTRATISLDELPASATSSTSAISSNNTLRDTCSTMHGDRNPLALAASEAAAASSSSSSATSAASSTPASTKTSSTQHKMSETGSAVVSMASNHSILFPFPSAAPSLNMAAAAAAYANRCLSGNCSCTAGGGQSSPTCPKNVQAGPLTGEGKRSEPNSIPHSSCQVIPPSGGVVSSNRQSSPTTYQLFANGPLQTTTTGTEADLRSMTAATSVVSQPDGDRQEENHSRIKRKSDEVLFLQKSIKRIAVQNSAVSTRLRSRPSQANSPPLSSATSTMGCIGLECSNKSQNGCRCCNRNVTTELQGGAATTNRSPIFVPHMKAGTAPLLITLDDSNGNHYTAESNMNGPNPPTGAGGGSSSRKRRKQHLIQRHDYELIGSFHSSTPTPPPPPSTSPPTCMKPFKEEPNRPSEDRSKSVSKKTATAAGAKAKENTKSAPPTATSNHNVNSVSINPIRKTQGQFLPTTGKAATGGAVKAGGAVVGFNKSRSLCTTPPLRWSNGWSWEGSPFQSLVYLRSEDAPATALRKCYPAMRHTEGDVVRTRDCILLKSGPKAKDLPFVAKVSALWENDDDGEMMMSLLWYYRPEHTDGGRRASDLDDDIFASRHRDICSVACIEDKCYVLTFNEYCRYRKQAKMLEMGLSNPFAALVQPSIGGQSSMADYPRRLRLPPACTSHDRVFICRKVYDYRQKRILKN